MMLRWGKLRGSDNPEYIQNSFQFQMQCGCQTKKSRTQKERKQHRIDVKCLMVSSHCAICF